MPIRWVLALRKTGRTINTSTLLLIPPFERYYNSLMQKLSHHGNRDITLFCQPFESSMHRAEPRSPRRRPNTSGSQSRTSPRQFITGPELLHASLSVFQACTGLNLDSFAGRTLRVRRVGRPQFSTGAAFISKLAFIYLSCVGESRRQLITRSYRKLHIRHS